jgi:putative membrane protein
MGRVAGWVLVLLVIPSVLWAVAEYFAYRYGLTGEELVLDYGVLRRDHRVLPLARVQSIDVRQSALQRLFGVAELHVETAGGETTEAVLSVLGIREAEALRTELLSRRTAVEAEPAAGSPPTVLARLSTGDLVLAGGTSNEAGIIAALLIGAVELIYEFRVPVPLPGVDLRALIFERPVADVVRTTVVLGVAVVLLAWIFSIAGALLHYRGFTLERTRNELHKRYGALSRRETSIPLERVQAVRIEESLLRRQLGLAALKIETAGAAPGQGAHRGVEAYLPLARTHQVPGLVAAVFEDLAYGSLEFRPVHPLARLHALVRYSAPLLALAAGLTVGFGTRWLWLLALGPLVYLAAHAHTRNLGYAAAPGYVALRGGFFTRTTWIVPKRRVQTLHLRETPFQRRHGLATLGVDTAAGEASVMDLRSEEARALIADLTHVATNPRQNEAAVERAT